MKKTAVLLITGCMLILLTACMNTGKPKNEIPADPAATSTPNIISAVSLPDKEAEPTPEPAPEPTPEPEKGTFGEKWGSMFTKAGLEEATETTYKNENVNITVTVHQDEEITYTVADIYIRDITNFKTCFSNDRYKGRSQAPLIQARNHDSLLAITGDYYCHEAKGLVIRNGEVYRDSLSSWDICVLFKDGTMKTYSAKEAKEQKDAILSQNPWQSWCFGPSLLVDGKAITKKEMTGCHVWPKNPRSAIGYYEPGHYCFVAVDGRRKGYSEGMNLDELSQLMMRLGCTEAYNLDGGASAAMVWQDTEYNKPSGGGRPVMDILYIDRVGEIQ